MHEATRRRDVCVRAHAAVGECGTRSRSEGVRSWRVQVISLHDLNMTTASFGADLWVWSTCPSRELRPLEVMDFPTAVRVDTRLESTLERNGVWWWYLKVSGVFRQHWDVRRYPFDRHVLRIPMENTNAPASEFSYRADRRGSRLGRDISVDGWQVSNFDIRAQTYIYDTTFGDPAFAGKEQSDYSRLEMSISIARTKRWSFVTLVAGVYIAFALSCLTFLLGPYNGRRRTNLIAGTLFAVVVNQRVADSVIGRTEHITFLDQIHLVGMIRSSGSRWPASRHSACSTVVSSSGQNGSTSQACGSRRFRTWS